MKNKLYVVMLLSDSLSIMVCPKCKKEIKKRGMFIICKSCKLAYPIIDKNIPEMLIEEAWKLDKAKKSKFIHSIKI